MPSQRQVALSRTIQRRTGPTFHLATSVLPRRIRHPVYVLYAFFRLADDVVDTTESVDPEVQRRELEHIREQALGRVEPEDPVLAAFHEVKTEYGISDEEVNVFIEAMVADVDHDPYERYENVEEYMRGSAVAVGHMMVDVMAVDEPSIAKPHAASLAKAFQLTNFLRDVREDQRKYDRVYLPGDTRDHFDVTAGQLRSGEVDDGFRRVMQVELARTEHLYHHGVAGIEYLPEDCQFGVLLAAVLYAEYHRLIRNQNFDVLSKQPSIPTWRKFYVLAKTRLVWVLYRDPESVFERVAAIDEPPPSIDGFRLAMGESETR
ncbi:MAG: phytoene/squalene synthase family protein [Halodesulfurarchaeum sp.]